MKSGYIAALAVALVAGSAIAAMAQDAPKTCEDFRCEFQQRISTECPCDGAGHSGKFNHGRYVSCVAHVVKDLVAEGLPRNCKGKLKRCAARSVCGKQDRGFVTCLIPIDQGTCIPTSSTTLGDPMGPIGSCDNTGAECASNADCLITRCHTKRGADKCEKRGGSVGDSPTCCSKCAVPAVQP
jgi:hypothetical protein